MSATITNTGARAGADVAQLYLGDPASSGEPSRQLKGFQRVNVAPGHSTGVQFTIAPPNLVVRLLRAGSSATGGGWSQTAGAYRVYVGDSSGLANLPLRGGFQVTRPRPPARSR